MLEGYADSLIVGNAVGAGQTLSDDSHRPL